MGDKSEAAAEAAKEAPSPNTPTDAVERSSSWGGWLSVLCDNIVILLTEWSRRRLGLWADLHRAGWQFLPEQVALSALPTQASAYDPSGHDFVAHGVVQIAVECVRACSSPPRRSLSPLL